MKKKKQPKKKKTFFERVSRLFLILAILFFLLAISGISEGVISVFVFCFLCGVVCIFVSRLLKKNSKINDRIAIQEEAARAADSACCSLEVSELKESVKNFNMVDITFPDGHIEKRHTLSTIDSAEGCLITDGGYTFHTDVGCFYIWSEKYRENFTGWQLISISEARKRGLRKCKFCVENDKW